MADIDRIEELMEQTGLASHEVAAGAGISPSTMRICLISRRLPEGNDARLKLAKFLQRNADARARADVRFV